MAKIQIELQICTTLINLKAAGVVVSSIFPFNSDNNGSLQTQSNSSHNRSWAAIFKIFAEANCHDFRYMIYSYWSGECIQ
jgi:hypothetical protein